MSLHPAHIEADRLAALPQPSRSDQWTLRAWARYTTVKGARAYVRAEMSKSFADGWSAIGRLIETCERPRGKFGLPDSDERLDAVRDWALYQRNGYRGRFEALRRTVAEARRAYLASDEIYNRHPEILAAGFLLRDLG